MTLMTLPAITDVYVRARARDADYRQKGHKRHEHTPNPRTGNAPRVADLPQPAVSGTRENGRGGRPALARKPRTFAAGTTVAA